MCAKSSYINTENKNDVSRDKDCIKTFCEFLSEHTMKTINFKKKQIKLWKKKQQKSYQNAKISILFFKVEDKYTKDKKILKVRDHCHYTIKYRGAAHGICKHSITK